MTHLSDEFLLAYLDGQIEQGQAAEVAQLAGDNVEVSRRLARLKRTQAQIVETFGGFAREEIALPRSVLNFDESEVRSGGSRRIATESHVKEQNQKGRGVRQLFFIVAVFAGGVLGGYGATLITGRHAVHPAKDTDRPPAAVIQATPWTAEIARFHSFFPRETLTPYPDAIANADLIRFQLSKITGKPLTPPDFSHQGFTLYRGQTFNYRQERMMQLAYSSKTEPPLVLYVLPAPELSDTGFAAQPSGSHKAVSWVADRVRFLLIGEKHEEDLKVLAALAQSQMPRKP
jgi:anti-sigma factor RsiW